MRFGFWALGTQLQGSCWNGCIMAAFWVAILASTLKLPSGLRIHKRQSRGNSDPVYVYSCRDSRFHSWNRFIFRNFLPMPAKVATHDGLPVPNIRTISQSVMGIWSSTNHDTGQRLGHLYGGGSRLVPPSPNMYSSLHATHTRQRRHPPVLFLVSGVYFVRMCLSFPGEYKKLLAYALGVKWRAFGS